MKRIFVSALFFMLAAIGVHAQSLTQRQKHHHTDKQHLALYGYDPVSYFKGQPMKGNKEWVIVQGGIHYRFANAVNRDAFKANPSKFEPAYGGWCAYAMALKGEKVEVDPLTYKISNGRLLLFYNKLFTNTLQSWNAQKTPEAGLLTKADLAWEKIILE